MEILYLTVVLAIIALCIVLFSTARRILHASPLTDGDLSITQMQRLTQSWEPTVQQSYEENSHPIEEPESANSNEDMDDEDLNEEGLNMEEYLLPQATPVAAAIQLEEPVAPAQQATMPEPQKATYFAEAPDAHIHPESTYEVKQERMEAPTPAAREDWMDVQRKPIREDSIRLRKSRDDEAEDTPRTQHYFLECLLLGISVLVLVKTQKSASQYGSQQSAHRVA